MDVIEVCVDEYSIAAVKALTTFEDIVSNVAVKPC